MARATVYSVDLQPILNVSCERALVMWLLGKVWVLKNYEDKVFRSVDQEFPAPEKVVVKKYFKLPKHYYGTAKLTVRNLRRRDDDKCQYCGKDELDHQEFWTRDHVMPVSRGGEDRWENVVLCCNTCNNIKGDNTPEEAGMELLNEPYVPTEWQLNSMMRVRGK